MGIKESIKWADKTYNFVRGCNGVNGAHCEYCYAVKFNKRTWEKMFEIEIKYCRENGIMASYSDLCYDMKNFKPVFMYSQFAKPLTKKPMRIFMDSMSDIAYWKPEWLEKVLDKIKEYPQHKFLFLTKHRFTYDCDLFLNNKDIIKNIFKGLTIINNENILWQKDIYFYSIEPIQEDIIFNNYNLDILTKVKWIIVGFQSNPFKKIEKSAIIKIIDFAKENKIPLFLKDNIYKGYSELPLIQEFPKELSCK